jgi:hypothetical protein
MDRRAHRAWPLLLLVSILGPATGALGQDCALNANPACGTAINLGSMAGDSGAPVLSRTGVGEAFFMVRIQEASSSSRPLNARVQLQVPPGQDYDLIVRCTSCTSTVAKTSRHTVGVTEVVDVTRADTFSDNSFTILVEVRYYKGSSCSPWTLTVSGNTAASQAALSCS